MGVKAYDWWTLMHFLYGVLTTMVICPEHPGIGILIGNIVHTYMEHIEKTYRKGVLVESDPNHMGDSIAFFLGTLVGVLFTSFTINHPIIRWVLLGVVIISTIQEWGREVYPESWPLDAANNPFGWFGTVTELVNKDKK